MLYLPSSSLVPLSGNCPNVKMDGDDDGVPCESQWCGKKPSEKCLKSSSDN
nr:MULTISPECIES: excalibur calcium-binding domain-containing protein [Microcystis]